MNTMLANHYNHFYEDKKKITTISFFITTKVVALFFRLHLFFRDRYCLSMLRVSFSQLHNKYF